MIVDRIKFSLILHCLVGMICRLNANAPENVIKDSQTKVSGTLIGHKGLLAVLLCETSSCLTYYGSRVSYDGKVGY